MADPASIGAAGDLLAAVEAKFNPTAEKDRLMAELRSLVRDEFTGEWLFRFAADLMIVHGMQSARADAGAIYEAVNKFIQRLRDFREAEARKGTTPKGVGRWFNQEIHAIAEKFGITTPRQRKQESTMTRTKTGVSS